MSPQTVAKSILPDEPIPWVRIARYAVLALVIVATGTLFAALLDGVLNFFTHYLAQISPSLAMVWADFLGLIRNAIRGFNVLVALGVFLTQFEFSGDGDSRN
jgi:hypothetical protein